jgi:hypothetical protein
MRLRDEFGPIYRDATFASLFHSVADQLNRRGGWHWSA